MARTNDAHRIALMRDLLMDYPPQATSNHGPPPDGLTPDEEDAWAIDQMERNAPPLQLEGRYSGDMGRPDAALVGPSQGAWTDVQALREQLQQLMPQAGQVAPVPEDPDAPPSRAQAIARMMRNG